MAAASVLKMVAAVCIAMLLVQPSVATLPGYPALGGGAGGLTCPSAETECRAKCRTGCDDLSVAMCQLICDLPLPITLAGSTCVNNFLIACTTVCKTACQTVPTKP